MKEIYTRYTARSMQRLNIISFFTKNVRLRTFAIKQCKFHLSVQCYSCCYFCATKLLLYMF